MNDTNTIKKLTADELLNELNGASPLHISKKLIEIELHDKQASIDVLNAIHKEFDNKENIVDELVNPLLLTIADGLIKHPKLNGTFRKTNITPSRLIKEVNSFDYSKNQKNIDEDVFLTQAEKTYYNNEKTGVDKNGKRYNKYFHRNKFYDTKARSKTEQEKDIKRNIAITYTNKKGEVKTKKTSVVICEITGKELDLTNIGANQKNIDVAQMDHIMPINHIRKKYKNNPYLYRDDLSKLISLSENESYINSSLNQSKGDMTWSEYIKKYPDKLIKEEQQKALELEEKAQKAQRVEATKLIGKNIGLKGLGDIIILLLKPIWFEIKDMFKNGILSGFETDDKIEAFILRLRRVKKFIQDNILNTLEDNLKEVFSNFVTMIISSIVDLFTGIFKKIAEIIVSGFMAVKEALIILMKPEKEISSAQKADAITKIIVTAIVPILTFSFEETLSKIPIIGDVATIIVSGLATTLVVWILDEIDIFSVKAEKRMQRIKEIFDIRIEAIKNNTDIFEHSSLETLAKQKIHFRKIIDDMHNAIEDNLNVNDFVYQMADFMGVDLKIRTTHNFLFLLETNKSLHI